ncbi:MAG TPA: DUF480 domain-containing protein [Pirellulaceae bacterium]|nr:DUF480 domain-containing protein [Pirellulaceae bacterium]
MNTEFEPTNTATSERKWRALTRAQRRVAGVLIEKSKTTPDVYPMTVNAIVTAANQKSNRSPLMQMEPEEVEATLDQLKRVGAVMEVQSDGRVPRFKHLLYDWFGVNRGELAVLAELMLRGQQTLGELRARTARMEDIADLQQLRPLVESLLQKELMLELTPPGRGQVVSHNLYQPDELDKVRRLVSSHAPSSDAIDSGGNQEVQPAGEFADLEARIAELERNFEALRQRVDAIES